MQNGREGGREESEVKGKGMCVLFRFSVHNNTLYHFSLPDQVFWLAHTCSSKEIVILHRSSYRGEKGCSLPCVTGARAVSVFEFVVG